MSRKSGKQVTTAENDIFEEDPEKALGIHFKNEACEARAMFLLSYMYFEGHGVIQDMNKGVVYLQKLVELKKYNEDAEHFISLALYFLGDLYYKGFILSKDDELAEKHWLRGAKMKKDTSTNHHFGSVQCQSSLGMFYSHPNHRHLNLRKAFIWHRKAAESGNLLSLGALGVMYSHGIGTKKNRKLAYRHLSRAAERGNTYAKGHLTAFYYKMKIFDSAIVLGRELAKEDNLVDLAKKQNCPEDHVRQGVSMGCYYLALCITERGNSMKIGHAKELIRKAIELSPSTAFDIHSKAILGIA